MELFVYDYDWPPQTCPRLSMSPRPAVLDCRLRGGIHVYGRIVGQLTDICGRISWKYELE